MAETLTEMSAFFVVNPGRASLLYLPELRMVNFSNIRIRLVDRIKLPSFYAISRRKRHCAIVANIYSPLVINVTDPLTRGKNCLDPSKAPWANRRQAEPLNPSLRALFKSDELHLPDFGLLFTCRVFGAASARWPGTGMPLAAATEDASYCLFLRLERLTSAFSV